MNNPKSNPQTIDHAEIENFAKDSSKWWDENGPFKPLHRLNPVRMHYIKEQICNHFDKDFNTLNALEGLNILDIGCGGGLACESLSRMGANVTGIDADNSAINAAQDHAKQSNLNITYIAGDAAELKDKFDVVLGLEVIEHTTSPEDFVNLCNSLMKPEGLIILSTLNRSKKSYALGIIAAEYIMRWVPRGTHTWSKFVKPSEIARYARALNLKSDKIKGLIYNPFKNQFELSDHDLDVNYLITLRRF